MVLNVVSWRCHAVPSPPLEVSLSIDDEWLVVDVHVDRVSSKMYCRCLVVTRGMHAYHLCVHSTSCRCLWLWLTLWLFFFL